MKGLFIDIGVPSIVFKQKVEKVRLQSMRYGYFLHNLIYLEGKRFPLTQVVFCVTFLYVILILTGRFVSFKTSIFKILKIYLGIRDLVPDST